jgi:hypothetical protein
VFAEASDELGDCERMSAGLAPDLDRIGAIVDLKAVDVERREAKMIMVGAVVFGWLRTVVPAVPKAVPGKLHAILAKVSASSMRERAAGMS